MADLGTFLRARREALGLTQEEVAELSGVHPTEVSRTETGLRDPRASTIRKLAKAVQVSPGELLEGGSTPERRRSGEQ